MIFFKYFFLSLFFLLASSPIISFACPESFSSDSVSSNSSFVNFAKKHLAESWSETMGAHWKQRITNSTKNWSRKDIEDFLNFLQGHIGTEDTLKRIKSPSYFHTTNYKKFRERVSLYEEYIGEEGVTMRLKRSLGGFHEGKISEIRDVIEYVKDYIGTEATRERMKKGLQGFSGTTLLKLWEVVEYVESYIGIESTKERMKKDLRSFSQSTLNQLRKWETDWNIEILRTRLKKYNFRYLLELYGN